MSQNQKELLMLVGLPRSGKSTWAKGMGFPIVNPDSIRLALHGKPFIGLAEPFVWAIAKVMVRSLFLTGHDVVILDATNTTKKRRDDWKSKDWVRTYKTFRTSKKTCIERALELEDCEHREGLISAIERMSEQYEEITSEEYDQLNFTETK